MPEPETEKAPAYGLVRMYQEMLDRLLVIAKRRKKTMAEVLKDLAGERIDQEYGDVLEEMRSELGESGGA